jgi:hypothetical protein
MLQSTSTIIIADPAAGEPVPVWALPPAWAQQIEPINAGPAVAIVPSTMHSPDGVRSGSQF